jgi:hypothetical protein
VEAEDVVNVLDNMLAATRKGGLILDLQVVPVTPTVEADGRVICDVDSETLFARARAATAAIDALIRQGRLAEGAIDNHDVRKHYQDGRELLEDLAGQEERLPANALPTLRTVDSECVIRHACRLRLLRTADQSTS